MGDNSTYDKEELCEMFERVNSQYLKLTGDAKKRLKRSVTSTWKMNKTIGALELFIHLDKAEEINDQKNKFFEQFLEESGMSVDEVKSKKPVSYAKHTRGMRSKDREIEYLQWELEDVLEDNNLISKDKSDETIKALKKEHKLQTEEQENKIIKLEQEINMMGKDLDSKLNIKDQQIEYYKNLSEKLLADQ